MLMNRKKIGLLGGYLLLLGVAMLQVGCSSFSKQWRASTHAPIPAATLEGPWEGKWISDVNGHNGRLRCIVTHSSDNRYDALFQAKYEHILTFSYTVPIEVRRDGNSWVFDGEADLGKMAGGVYTYQGAVTSSNFFSTYDNKYDHGKFQLKRPE